MGFPVDMQAAGFSRENWPGAFNLLAGDGDVVTKPQKAATGVDIAQFEVYAEDANGFAVKFDPAGSAPVNKVVGIAAQATAAAGGEFPGYVGGIFNHAVLVWPSGFTDLRKRMAAFTGTTLGVRELL